MRPRRSGRPGRAGRSAASAKRPSSFHARLAFNYRLPALQAALGLAQVERLDALVERRALIREWYREELDGVAAWREPRVLPQAEAVNWLFTGVIDGWRARRRDVAVVAAALRAAVSG